MSTYPDELRLTEYLLERLEVQLAGREEPVCMDKVPSDRYHLGVLTPRQGYLVEAETEQAEDAEDILSTGSEDDEGAGDEPDLLHPPANPQVLHHKTAPLAHRQTFSALGADFKVVSTGREEVELEFDVRFAIYTRRFPTLEEQREFAGSIDLAAGQPAKAKQPGKGKKAHHPGLPIREKYIRHEVAVQPIRVSLSPAERAHQQVVEPIQGRLDQVLQQAAEDPLVWRTLTGPQTIPLNALVSPETYLNHLAKVTGEPNLPPFSALLDVRSAPAADGGLRVTAFLINNIKPAATNLENAGRCLIDAQLAVRVVAGRLTPVELTPTPEDYQFERQVWAVGHGASLEVIPERHYLRTRALARYQQFRLATKQEPSARFADLAARPFEILDQLLAAMSAFEEQWATGLRQGRLQAELSLTEDQAEFCQRDLDHFRREVQSFQDGIEALQADERLLTAFRAMNRVFGRIGADKGFDRWYLFQICFIVSQLPALAVREGKVQSDSLEWADVLWFATGGGKTEAYLGLIVCAALYDRLRGKQRGVTAWLRFPLRMLSVQQLHRAMQVLWAAEQERQQLPGGWPDESDPISLGYFVGQGSTPNSLDNRPDNPWRLQELAANPRLREKVQVVSTCPNCKGDRTIEVQIDAARHRIRHVCRQCGVDLPVFVSDAEIYRFLPTVIIGTVDKLATLAYQARFSALWGGVSWRCGQPEHGYNLGEYCAIYGCPASHREPVTLYDPAPALYIQDELHLLQEELGAFTGHYETLARYCQQQVGGRPPKVLAATATIEGVDHQTRHLYGLPARRFPERGYRRWESFYTTLERDERGQAKTSRHYVAFRSHYMNSSEAALLCLEILHREIRQLYADPLAAAGRIGLQDARTQEDVLALLHLYDTSLTYVSSKAAGTRIEKMLDEDVGKRLPPAGSRELGVTFLSGQSSLPDIHGAVVRLEQPPRWDDADRLDALVATSLISHGVDVERLNLMVMNGMPGRMAEYIQASSRSGRRHVGLVLVVFSPSSIRDQSIYHRFVEHHRNLEMLVTPVPINRFAKFVVRRTLPGLLSGLILGCYIPQLGEQGLKRTHTLLKAIEGIPPFEAERQLPEEQLLAALLAAYGLGQGRYEASLELAMKAEIGREFRRQLRQLRVNSSSYIFNALTPPPMRSLRDVDRPVGFEPDPSLTGWEQLRWLDRYASSKA